MTHPGKTQLNNWRILLGETYEDEILPRPSVLNCRDILAYVAELEERIGDVGDVPKAVADYAVERARNEAIEEAAKAVEEAGYYCLPPFNETGHLSEQIGYSVGAIRALKT